MHNVINIHVNHHAGPIVDTSCPHDGFFASSLRHRVCTDYHMSHSTDVISDHVGRACSTYNYFQNV